jgi:hypothetical protein
MKTAKRLPFVACCRVAITHIPALPKAGGGKDTLKKWASLFSSPTRAMFELYDLQADPAELNNLAGTSAAAVVENELKAALQE